MPTNVIDTNVLAAANGKADHVDEVCQFQCKTLLNGIREAQMCVSIDDEGEIFREYRRYADMKGQPGEGDAFIRWLHENIGGRCELVDVSTIDDDQLPKDFDKSDYKFLKVAFLTDYPPATIHNATDNEDWKIAFELMKEHRILFNQVC